MDFAKEINQTKPFTSQAIKAMLNTVYTASKLQERQIALLKPYKINDQHYNILRILKGKKGKAASPGQIKEVLIFSRGDLTRLIDKLVKLNFVVRKHNKNDRRGVEITISTKGAELIEKIEQEFINKRVYDFNITEKEAQQLNTLLDKLRESK